MLRGQRLSFELIDMMDEKAAQDTLDKVVLESDEVDAQIKKFDISEEKTALRLAWRHSAYIALKVKRRHIQRLQQHIKQIKKGRESSFSVNFVKVAETILNSETFAMISESARSMKGVSNG